ncbi:MAG: adenylate/guanylate cyclase domain-containing protein [Acidimicrobiales bacterium]
MRTGVWCIHVGLPVLALWLLLAVPEADVRWEHHGGHAALVVLTALVSLALAVLVVVQAVRQQDRRLGLVGLCFTSAATGLLVHGLVTPQLWASANLAFAVSTPVGLLVASGFAVAAAFSPGGWSPGWQRLPWVAAAIVVAGLLVAMLTVTAVGPFAGLVPTPATQDLLVVLGWLGAALFVVAAARLVIDHRRRPSVVVLSLLTAFVLLAEALIAAAYGRNWQLSWWAWHLLMAFSFAFVAYAAAVQRSRGGSATALFAAVSLRSTADRQRDRYGEALESTVAAMEAQAEHTAPGDEAAVEAAATRLGDELGLNDNQVDVLVRAAGALTRERDRVRRLDGLVAVGRSASVIVDDAALVDRALDEVARAFRPDHVRVWLVEDGRVVRRSPGADPGPSEGSRDDDPGAAADLAPGRAVLDALPDGGLVADVAAGQSFTVPFAVKGHPAGAVEVVRDHGGFAADDLALARSLALQLGMAVENARLYTELDGLFRAYLAPDVAAALIADPRQAGLGGTNVDISVLFADLRGFTSYSEQATPAEVVAMLNDCYEVAVPEVLAQGGTISSFIGDAIMAVFNAPARQPDHAARAVRAAMGLNRAVDALAAERPGWPRFRCGVNSGPAVVGNIGSEQQRHFTAIGDTVNLASRLEGVAGAGEVVIGPATRALLGDAVEVDPLGPVVVKGKREPVEACRVVRLVDEA